MESLSPKRSKQLLIIVIIIAFIFRFYNLYEFQFWTEDEGTSTLEVRKMITEKKPVLITHNSNLGASLGPYFHYLSVPLFLIAKLNPQIILAATGILGVITTFIIFQIGRSAKDIPLGLTAALLYSSSFVTGLFDRRWWTLSLNPFLAAVSIYSIYQIKTKKYIYIVPLAIAIGFALHADPSLAIIAFSAILSFLILRISLFKREYLLAILVLLLFILPLAIFELRHPGAIVHPLIQSINNNSSQAQSPLFVLKELAIKTSIILSNLTFPKFTDFAETYITSGFSKNGSLFGQHIIPAILLLLSLYPIFKILRKEVTENEKVLLTVSYTFILSFFIATVLYASFSQKPVHQNYFTVIFPAFFILIAFTLVKIDKSKKILFAFLIIYLSANTIALTKSSFKYPLYQKVQMVKQLSQEVEGDFSFYAPGDAYFMGGGYTTLFVLENKTPKRSFTYDYYDWIYKAYSLYSITPDTNDQKQIVIISQKPQRFEKSKIIYSTRINNLYGLVLDNSNRWFNQAMLEN